MRVRKKWPVVRGQGSGASIGIPKDYRIFKAAGLLNEWRRKWAAYLPR